MEAVVTNHIRSFRYDAALASLVLDNLQYHFEGNSGCPLFLATHALVEAPWLPKGATVSAGKLCDELSSCWPKLSALRFESLAISYKTFLIGQGVAPSRSARSAVLQATVPWEAPYDFTESGTLGEVAGDLMGNLIRLAREAPRRSRLLVRVNCLPGVSRTPV